MPGAFTLWTFTESMSTFILATNRKISGMLKKKKKAWLSQNDAGKAGRGKREDVVRW